MILILMIELETNSNVHFVVVAFVVMLCLLPPCECCHHITILQEKNDDNFRFFLRLLKS